jgi:peptidoglycan-associated lipoprotein
MTSRHHTAHLASSALTFTPRLVAAATLGAIVLLAGCASDKAKSDASSATPQTAVPPAAAPATAAASSGNVQGKAGAAVAAPLANSVYFDFDSYAIKDQRTVSQQAGYQQQQKHLELQGNADERGSREYNMALGQKRADSVKKALTALGVKADKIDTISYGEDKPKAKGHDEAAWAENRRVDFVNK